MANVPVSNMTATWTDSGTTYNAVKMNVTDTASNAASLLMDLGTGGGSYVSKFKVDKTGRVSSGYGYVYGKPQFYDHSIGDGTGFQVATASGCAIYGSGTALLGVDATTTNGLRVSSNLPIGWTNGHALSSASDAMLSRKAAANIRLGNADAAAPVAQTLSVQSVVAGTTNIAGTDLTITGSQGTGTGAGGKITFSAANAGTSGSTQNPLVDRMRISGIDANTALFELNSNGGYVNFTVGGNTLAISTGTGSSNNHDVQLPGFIAYRGSVGYGVAIGTGASMPVLQGGVQEDSDALAQRRATNAQTFRVYNTYTNSTNYERGFLKWATNILAIGTEKGSGGGTARDLAFQTDGTTRMTIGTTGIITTTSDVRAAGSLEAGTSNSIYFNNRTVLSSSADGLLRLGNQAGTDFGRIQFGGTTSSFPSLKRSATTLQVRLADDSAFAPLEASTLTTSNAYTVATLPAAGVAGRRAYVTDATAPTFLGALTGGGAVKCPVFDNGTAWVAG